MTLSCVRAHTFNLLDARGYRRHRAGQVLPRPCAASHAVAELYIRQREQEEFPWLDSGEQTVAAGEPSALVPSPDSLQEPATEAQDLILELGSEELPAADVVDGMEQIRRLLSDLLSDARLAYTDLHVTGTPRRLIAYVTGLAPRQTDETLEKRGPALDRAYDADGRPTRAAQGFAAGQGVPVEDLVARDNYVYAVKRVDGRSAADVLPQVCIALLEGLRWNKAMRWNSSGIAYPRPLRWIVALYGERVIPFAFAGVVSGRTSRGPRYADAAAGLEAGEFTTFDVASGADYFAAVAAQGVVVNREERRRLIQQLVQDAAAQANGYAPEDPDLLDEVTDLVESPQALLGRFEDKYLELPMPVLIGVMKKQQRYFPVLRDGQMLPYFINAAANARAPGPARCGDGRQRRRNPPLRRCGLFLPAGYGPRLWIRSPCAWARLPSMSGLAPCSTRWSV